MKKINVIISGVNGAMGQIVAKTLSEDEDFKIHCGIDMNGSIHNDFQVYKSPSDLLQQDVPAESRVIIDFSHPSLFDNTLSMAVTKKIPLVVATTALSESQLHNMKLASNEIPIFHSANMSLGLNLLLELVKKTVKTLGYDFDIEIIEKHHNRKVDAPSGSANMILDTVKSINPEYYPCYDRSQIHTKRDLNEIGMMSLRGGTIVGEHSVIFAGDQEILEIKHNAESRKIFALGALKAAKFLVSQSNGLYSMQHIMMI